MNGDIGDGRTDGRRLRRSIEGRNRRETREGRKEERKIGERKWLTRDAQIWPPPTNECYVVVLIGGVLDRKTTEGGLLREMRASRIFALQSREVDVVSHSEVR